MHVTTHIMPTAFKVNRIELWRALNFERNSPRAKQLHSVAALTKGELIYMGDPAPADFIPACQIDATQLGILIH